MNEGPASLGELLSSNQIPNTWVATFVYDRWWWLNQEDGWSEDSRRPHWVDVEMFLFWFAGRGLTGQEL